jgi:peptidyl-tRNA hydrolase
MLVNNFVDREKIGSWEYQNKRKGEIIECNIANQKVFFLKPMEFMNRS